MNTTLSRRIGLSLLLIPTLLLVAGLGSSATAQSQTPAGGLLFNDMLLFRVYFDETSDLTPLTDLDIWEINWDQKYVLVAGDLATIAALRADGRHVLVDRPQTLEVMSIDATALFEGGYRTVDELYADLDELAAANPTLTELYTYGQSYCKLAGGCTTPDGLHTTDGYDLRAIRITNETISGSSTIAEGIVTRGTKPILYVEAAIHSREITTPELAMRLAEWFLDGYGTDADATWLVDWHEIWIVPMVNPDGHWLVELGATKYGGEPFYHRKNANADADENGTRDCNVWTPKPYSHFGVDLNRNHSFNWGLPGASTNPCDQTYRGPGSASEPETSRREVFIRQLFADQRGPNLNDAAPDTTTGILLTLHSYGNFVLYSWGYNSGSAGNYAPNADDLKAVSDRLARLAGATSCQPTKPGCLGGASGATDDWAYGELGIPGLTIEIGDKFMPPYSVIDSIQWPNYGPAFIHAAKLVREPYRLAHGPDVTNPSISASANGVGVIATISDSNTGGRVVAAAEYSIGVPFWAAGADPQPFAAADGAFDEKTELITAEIMTDSLGEGKPLVYLRGRDADGNWGPVTAAFLDTEAVDAPQIIDFTPTSGGAGTVVTINGANLSGTTAVSFGGIAAAGLSVVSDTQLTAVVPVGVRTGTVIVTTPDGTATSTADFVVLPAATISSVAPRAGRAGTVVTVRGTGLVGVSGISFNGAPAADIRPVNSTLVRVVVPAAATTGPISLTTAAGTVSSPSPFTVLPSITDFTPSAAAANTQVIINGTAFTGVRAVSVGRQAATFTVLSATQLRVTVPTTARTGKIIITTTAGKASSKTALRIIAAPKINSIKPGHAAVGATVAIIGRNLRDADSVSFNGRPAEFRVISAGRLLATVPPGATSGSVTVSTPGGTGTSPALFVVD